MAYKPPIHGRDHCLGGSDPIPATCLSSSPPWARRRVYAQANQSIPSGTETNVTMDNFQTSDAATFSAWDSGTEDGITPLVAGLYSIQMRLYWSQWPGDQEMTINGIDPDAFAGFTIGRGTNTNTLVNAGALVVRLAANQHLYMSTYHLFGSARNLFGGAGAGGGSFFEMAFLGITTLTDRDWA